jgi:hypothetical protein
MDHEKCFRMNQVLGTRHSAARVEAAMSSGFGWPLHMPSLIDHQDVDLVGSRPCLYGEGLAAHIMFTTRGEPVSLFMLPHETRVSEVVNIMGHQCRIWSEGERTFVLVARDSAGSLDDVATLVRNLGR